ncbi:conserved Plasmodium protein, unknown function [Plasmodium malariae]|uniref:Uncharacterized protein n=1 Tax=Plasmodium malariae TaxID=5858 RepID=A0A1A8VMJ4_PLAMA|nr:conserved Plasmodium protein, unknown function [Plasmodium malariae]SBS81541.1 conserved Plasmodium protein, unknown function [Plasmodium malariae]SBT86997.1 conserved Plasmodium protein, unknown function [Plasmodium malariae]
MSKSGEYVSSKENDITTLKLNEKQEKRHADLPTFSESPKINSEVYENILKLYNQKSLSYSKEKLNIVEFEGEQEEHYGKISAIEEAEDEEVEGKENEDEGSEVNHGKFYEDYEKCYHLKREDKYSRAQIEKSNEFEIYGHRDGNDNGGDDYGTYDGVKNEVKKEKSIDENHCKYTTLKIKATPNGSSNELKNVTQDSFIKEVILDIQKNTVEHKKTNYLCLEEILKKINFILKEQIEINRSNVSHRSDRQILFQNVYEVLNEASNAKMNVCMNKAFNSLSNKDFAKYYVKNNLEKKKGNGLYGKNSSGFFNSHIMEQINEIHENNLTNVVHTNDKYLSEDSEKLKIYNKNVQLFLFHLDKLEKSMYAFTHFCRNASNETYHDSEISLNSQEQKIFSFLQDPRAMRLVRTLEKNLTQIKSICTDTPPTRLAASPT